MEAREVRRGASEARTPGTNGLAKAARGGIVREGGPCNRTVRVDLWFRQVIWVVRLRILSEGIRV